MKPGQNPYLTQEQKYFLYTFRRQPLLLTKARGSYVWDIHGKRYLDFFSGLAVCGIGHNDPRVVAAIKRQAGALIHSSNYFYTRPQFELARLLTSKMKGSKVFFCNSGAEANELAIKLARLWAAQNKKAGREIIGYQNSFHGRTLATLAASNGWNKQNDYFAPLPTGFRALPFNDFDKTRKAVSKNTIAILLEPIQGEGGIHAASKEFLKGLARLCRERDLLLILDEIQCGLGRTGTFFACESYGLKPDIVTLAKGLAGGLPLGATLANERVARHMRPGLHGSTFGGNPVACAASLEVLKRLSPKALASIRHSAEYLKEKLSQFHAYASVKAVRGRGLMMGIELNEKGDAYVALARQRGLLINCTQGNVLRFLPPYFMTKKEMDQALSMLGSVFETLSQ